MFLTVPDLPGLELMSVENSTRLFRFFHESFDLCVVPVKQPDPKAYSQWRFRRWREVAHPGCVMLTEPGETHVTLKVPRPATYWVLLFAPGLVASHAADLGWSGSTHFRTCQTAEPQFRHHLERLCEVCMDRTATPLVRQTHLAKSLEHLLTGYCEKRPARIRSADRRQVQSARDFIVDHYDGRVTLDDLIAISGLSRFHLIRSFAKQYGVPPHQFQIRVRVERARQLLRTGDATEAAALVGFADQSHLIRHFKRIIGVTPATYQHQVAT
jgi:AraC-like DNA-binding protein